MPTNLNFRRILGTAGAAAVLMGTGALALAAPASAQPARPWPVPVTAAATMTTFPLNGIYTDGGSARPQISDNNDALTIDMSSQNRPTAWGTVTGPKSIAVTFPDEGRHMGTLVASGRIDWDNGSHWQKLATVAVPDVQDFTKAQAVAVIQTAGLTPVAQSISTCDVPQGHVEQQLPAGGTQVLPGSLVHIWIAVKPPPNCR